MRKGPSTRASGFTESVIREMTRLCQAYGAVNLAQGFPDFDPPVSIKQAAATAISKGYNQYSTTYGTIGLRKAIAGKMKTNNQMDCSLDGITDGIYRRILYDGHEQVSLGSLPGMEDRTITSSGVCKHCSVPGWRVGYVVASKPLACAIRKVHDFLTVGAPPPLQEACTAA